MSIGEGSRGNDGHADLHDIATRSATRTPRSPKSDLGLRRCDVQLR
jgi:hypothetical protein